MGDHRGGSATSQRSAADYPGWNVTVGVRDVLQEIYDANVELWSAGRLTR